MVAGLADLVQVEFQQQLAGRYTIAFFDIRSEVLTIQLDRIDPDMDQNFRAVIRDDRQSVLLLERHGDGSVERSDDPARSRLDGHALAHRLRGEGRIGHLRQRNHRTA